LIHLSRAKAAHNNIEGTFMEKGLFSRSGVRYEVACDVIGSLIAHYSEVAGAEMEKDQPDQAAIDAAEAEKSKLRKIRDELDPANADGIEQVIAEFAPKARALYRQG
jgi:hypothetical protein